MPAINNPSQYFGVITYTGDGSSSKTVVDTSAIQFTPDFVWIKGRSGATDHALYDAVRGSTKDLVSNSTAAETTQSTGVTGFVNGGFTVGNLAKLNTSGATYVAWCWKANGAGSSNTSGSITSTVSVSTTAGFSIVTYTGTGANATVGHGLGVTPKMVIVKRRNTTGNWQCWHTSFTGTQYITLNLSGVVTTNSTVFNGTPTSTIFNIGSDTDVNASTSTYVAYCFAEIAGFSKFGSYTGNGSADGPFVYTGFRPRYILIKSAGTANGWGVFDTARKTFNVNGTILAPNASDAEATYTQWQIDILSNGFKVRSGANNETNGSNVNYIYAAFAENPFKNSNAR